MSINLQFDEEKREGIEQAWTQWWAGELERPIVTITDPPRFPFAPKQFTKAFCAEIPIDEALDHYQAQMEATHYYADALPTFFPLHFGAAGPSVTYMPEHLTVWYEPEMVPLEDIRFAYDPSYPQSRMMQLLARAVERFDSKVTIPHTGLYNGIQSLTGQRTTNQLLLDLIDSPDEVVRAARALTEIGIRHYEASYEVIKASGRGTTCWSPLWSAERTALHECDFSCMISPKMFEKFVLPDLEKAIQHTNHAFYHLDGEDAITHLDALLSIEGLLGIQWVPEAGKPQGAEWNWLFKRIKDGGKLCQIYVNADEALEIVREVGGRGMCLIITGHPQIPPDEIDDFLAALAAEDADAR